MRQLAQILDKWGMQTLAAAEEIDNTYVLIPRAELPEVKPSEHDPNMYYSEGENIVYTSAANARMWVMRDVAVWQHIEAAESERLMERRDALAEKFAPRGDDRLGKNWYGNVSDGLRQAIDHIIELEAKL